MNPYYYDWYSNKEPRKIAESLKVRHVWRVVRMDNLEFHQKMNNQNVSSILIKK